MTSMSSMTSLVSVTSLSFLVIFPLLSEFSMFQLSTLDALSAAMLWLTIFSVVLSFLLGAENGLLWWVILVVVSVSFLVIKFLLFYILFELSLVPILIMIIYYGNQPERLTAGMAFILYTLFLSIPYLFLLSLFLSSQDFFTKSHFFSSTILMELVLLAPFLVKMPILGLHYWLPKAHVEANTSGSMVLAGLLLKLGSYGVTRVMLLFPSFMMMHSAFLWMFFTIVSSFITFMQSDIKKMVAYSSVTHMTFMMLGAVVLSKLIFLSILILSLAHGWASMGMFQAVGAAAHSSFSRMNYLISSEYSLHALMLVFGGLLVSNSSIPPTPSFFSEMGLLMSFASTVAIYNSSLFVVVSVVVCYYNAFLFSLCTSVKPKETGVNVTHCKEFFLLALLLLITFLSVGWMQIMFSTSSSLLF